MTPLKKNVSELLILCRLKTLSALLEDFECFF